MKKLLLAAALLAVTGMGAKAQLIITGIGDGPLTGGTPKFLEIYVTEDVADLSTWSVQNYNNGGTTATTTFSLSGSATAGTFLYVATETPNFNSFFGFNPTFTSSVMNVNGDDAVLLRNNGIGVDVFGVIGVDGTGQAWEYLDGWGYSNNNRIASTTFNGADWFFSGINQLEGGTTNGTTFSPFPGGTFTAVPEPTVAGMLVGAFGMLALRRRRA